LLPGQNSFSGPYGNRQTLPRWILRRTSRGRGARYGILPLGPGSGTASTTGFSAFLRGCVQDAAGIDARGRRAAAAPGDPGCRRRTANAGLGENEANLPRSLVVAGDVRDHRTHLLVA